MDKLLNSSFYLHLEKGPEFAKRFRILDVLDSKVKYGDPSQPRTGPRRRGCG